MTRIGSTPGGASADHVELGRVADVGELGGRDVERGRYLGVGTEAQRGHHRRQQLGGRDLLAERGGESGVEHRGATTAQVGKG
jgi:hypothetical protein